MDPTWKHLDKAPCHFHRETRFADPAWTRNRDQAHILTQQEIFGGSYFCLSPHKPGPLHRKIGGVGLHRLNWVLREAVAYGCKRRCCIFTQALALSLDHSRDEAVPPPSYGLHEARMLGIVLQYLGG